MTEHPRPGLLGCIALAIGMISALAVALFAAWVAAAMPMLGMFSDTIAYLVIADFFAVQAVGQTDPVLSSAFATTRFPPLYPAVLAAVGAGLSAPGPAVFLCAMLVVSTAGAFLVWQWREGKQWAAAALLPVACCAPGVADWILIAPSEPLFVVLMLAALAMVPRSNQQASSLLPLALLVGLLPLARSAGWAVVAGLLAWLMLQPARPRASRAAAAIMAVLPGLVWSLYRLYEPVQNSYGDALDRYVTLETPAQWLAAVATQSSAVAHGWRYWFGSPDGVVATSVLAAIAGLSIVGLVAGVRMRRLDALVALFYLPLIAVWPYPDEMPRLVGVAMPLLAVAIYRGALLVTRLPAGSRMEILPALVIGILGLVLAMPRWHTILERASTDVDPALVDAQRSLAYFGASSAEQAAAGLELIAHARGLIRAMPDEIPAAACVYTIFPALAQFELGRRVEIVDLPELANGDRDVASRLDRCDYVLGVFLESPQRGARPLHPLPMLAEIAVPVLVAEVDTSYGRITAAALVRIERDRGAGQEGSAPDPSRP